MLYMITLRVCQNLDADHVGEL